MSKELWNERFAHREYAYGEEPNAFLKESADLIAAGPVLCLADGEGRNGVYLASLGHKVTSVDWSDEGLKKAQALASGRHVSIETILSDLTHYSIEEASWSGIVLIFAHFPPELRLRIHRQSVKGLAPGGVLILEAYTKEQINYGTGGPRDPELLMSREQVLADFADLTTVHISQTVRNITEGLYHTGNASVIQFVGRKPEH